MSTFVELAGYAALVVAGFYVAAFVGFAVLGLALLVIARGLENGEPVPIPAFVKALAARCKARRATPEASP